MTSTAAQVEVILKRRAETHPSQIKNFSMRRITNIAAIEIVNGLINASDLSVNFFVRIRLTLNQMISESGTPGATCHLSMFKALN